MTKKELHEKLHTEKIWEGGGGGQSCAAGPKLRAQNNFLKCGRPLLGIPLPQEMLAKPRPLTWDFGLA